MHGGHAGGRPPDPRPRREAGFGGRGRRCRTTGAGTAGGIVPFNRGDRRSLPLRVLSRWRVKGPLRRPRRLDAVPRHHAVRRRERPASPNDVPASRPPLTRRQRSASAPTAAPPRPSPNPLPPLVAGPTMPATPRPNRQPSSMRGRPVQAHNLIGKRYPGWCGGRRRCAVHGRRLGSVGPPCSTTPERREMADVSNRCRTFARAMADLGCARRASGRRPLSAALSSRS